MVYTLIFALNANNDRGYLILFMVIFWGVRLTINFYRKGGYNGEEDYRWAVL
jgi:steroid 5-alpha reductase family enzyme